MKVVGDVLLSVPLSVATGERGELSYGAADTGKIANGNHQKVSRNFRRTGKKACPAVDEKNKGDR